MSYIFKIRVRKRKKVNQVVLGCWHLQKRRCHLENNADLSDRDLSRNLFTHTCTPRCVRWMQFEVKCDAYVYKQYKAWRAPDARKTFSAAWLLSRNSVPLPRYCYRVPGGFWDLHALDYLDANYSCDSLKMGMNFRTRLFSCNVISSRSRFLSRNNLALLSSFFCKNFFSKEIRELSSRKKLFTHFSGMEGNDGCNARKTCCWTTFCIIKTVFLKTSLYDVILLSWDSFLICYTYTLLRLSVCRCIKFDGFFFILFGSFVSTRRLHPCLFLSINFSDMHD